MTQSTSQVTHDYIPILDLGSFVHGDPEALESLASELRYALENIGFFYIINHDVPQDLIDQAFSVTREFHALPLEQKLEIEVNEQLTGYMRDQGQKLTTSQYADGDKPDRGAAFFMIGERGPRTTKSPNKWPPSFPGFRDVLVNYYETMEKFGIRLLPVFARALDLPADYFEPHFTERETFSFERVSHYPPDGLEAGQYSCGPHTDGSFLTMLATSEVPGLEIGTPEGEWIKAPLWRGAFLVNSGDMLTRWSNGRFLSTPHRVINTSGDDRYAIPFFMQPNPDAMLRCLPTCFGSNNPPKEEPISCADYCKYYIENNFVHYDDGAEAVVS